MLVECPSSFVELCACVRRRLTRQPARGQKIRLLSPSLQIIVTEIEKGTEFTAFVDDLPEEWTSEQDPYEAVGDVLKRSGFYHALLENKDPRDCWPAILDRLVVQARPCTVLYLLDRCSFPKDDFGISGDRVAKMNRAALMELSCGRPSEDFFAGEYLTSRELDWLSDQWFLCRQEKVASGIFEKKQEARFIKIDKGIPLPPPPLQVAAGIVRDSPEVAQKPSRQMPPHLASILLLSLYNREFFQVPVILLSEPRWRLLRTRFIKPPYKWFEEPTRFEIKEAEWARFEKFLSLAERGLAITRCWDSFEFAASKYLASGLVPGDPLRVFEVEDELKYMELCIANEDVLELAASHDCVDRHDVEGNVLLHYVFALEGLVGGDEKEGLAERIATRTALIVGDGDVERADIYRVVKGAYGLRSKIVHGSKIKKAIHDLLPEMRRIVQRALVIVIALAAQSCTEEKAFLDILRTVTMSESDQKRVREARSTILEIVQPQ